MSDLSRSTYDYRPMTAADIDNAHALSVALHWPHRRDDWAMLQRVAQGFVAEQDGVLIGSAFACHQGEFSTIGLVIVSNQHQGKGIGRQLMEQALAATAPRTALLNATLAGTPLYSAMGFKAIGHIQQRQGKASPLATTGLPSGETSRPLNSADNLRLVALANAGSGLQRSAVLEDLLLDIVDSIGIEREGQLQGFALLRPFGRGLCIGPVIAQNLAQAQHMIASLLNSVPEAFVRIDIPADCGLAPWLENAGLVRVDSVTQMTLGPVPQTQQGLGQFALITQAIG